MLYTFIEEKRDEYYLYLCISSDVSCENVEKKYYNFLGILSVISYMNGY